MLRGAESFRTSSSGCTRAFCYQEPRSQGTVENQQPLGPRFPLLPSGSKKSMKRTRLKTACEGEFFRVTSRSSSFAFVAADYQ